MKIKVVQKTELFIAFIVFLVCCVLSFMESSSDTIENTTASITSLVGG